MRQAEADRAFHREQGHRGNVELAIAGFKIAWLKGIIKKVEQASKS